MWRKKGFFIFIFLMRSFLRRINCHVSRALCANLKTEAILAFFVVGVDWGIEEKIKLSRQTYNEHLYYSIVSITHRRSLPFQPVSEQLVCYYFATYFTEDP